MQVDDFLRTVVTTEQGYFCLAFRDDNGWQEDFFKWPEDLDKILGQAIAIREHGDVYFSPHLFAEQRSLKQYVLPTRTLQADLDEADTATISVLPTVLVQTSPQRHQGYWVTDKALTQAELEALTRRIAYGVPNCDHTGWPAGKKLRLPNTYNFKYASKKLVEIAALSVRPLPVEIFNNFPPLEVSKEQAEADVEWVEQEPEPLDVQTIQLLHEVKDLIPARVFSQYAKPAKDRSAALWAFNTECLKAGLSREQVYNLAQHNINNKFADRNDGGRDLRKDILRAETNVVSKKSDLKAILMDIRSRAHVLAVRRAQLITEVIINYMRENGEFVHAKSNSMWYLRKDTGRPIFISNHSEWLLSYLSNIFGLNSTETYTRFVISELIAYTKTIPQSDDLQYLSYFDNFTGKLLVHTGGRDVLHVSKDTIEVQPNGYGSVVFQWSDNIESFTMGNAGALPKPWEEEVFDSQVRNLTNLERDEALAILRAWILFLLFRNLATTRPIFALIGQPGSGKTTLAKKVYRLLYGRYKNISGLFGPEEFDMATSTYPLVAYDNVDSWNPWLPDRLAMSTSNTDMGKRKLYTDLDMISLRRQASLMLTAHNPKFTREDVMDRMILFLFSRLTNFENETNLLEYVSANRNDLWASIVLDAQRVLATPKPAIGDAPQFRIEDFSYLGVWFSRAAGPDKEAAFRRAINKIQGSQRTQNLEHDQLLVAAISSFVAKQETPDYYRNDQLHSMLTACASDSKMFLNTYKLPLSLHKKLWVMQDSLKLMFDISWKKDDNGVTTLWRIAPKST